MRLVALIDDTMHVPSDIMETACHDWRQGHDWMPTTNEIMTAAREAMRPKSAKPASRDGALADRARSYNRDNEVKGVPNRWTDPMEQFRIGDPGERRATRDDGSVIVPWLGDDKQWHPPHGDGPALDVAYRRHASSYSVRDGIIIDTRPMPGPNGLASARRAQEDAPAKAPSVASGDERDARNWRCEPAKVEELDERYLSGRSSLRYPPDGSMDPTDFE